MRIAIENKLVYIFVGEPKSLSLFAPVKSDFRFDDLKECIDLLNRVRTNLA